MNDIQPTNQEMLDIIVSSFSDVKTRMATKEDLKAFATKEDLKAFATKEDLGKMQHHILDGVDRKISDLKGDLVIMMRNKDHKVTELIKVLEHKKVLDESEAQQLLKLQSFPQT